MSKISEAWPEICRSNVLYAMAKHTSIVK